MKYLFAFTCLLFFSHAFAGEVETAQDQLQSQKQIFAVISPTLERVDLGRLRFIESLVDKVRSSIRANGLAHMETIRNYQELIVAYRFSADFFQKITTGKTQASIAQLLKISDTIASERGFDDSPYTQLIASIFSQLKKLTDDLKKADLSPELGQALTDLLTPMGETIAVAKQGDRPKAFAQGDALYLKIRALYPEFDHLSENSEVFQTVISIQGLNEFYGEYAQVRGRL